MAFIRVVNKYGKNLPPNMPPFPTSGWSFARYYEGDTWGYVSATTDTITYVQNDLNNLWGYSYGGVTGPAIALLGAKTVTIGGSFTRRAPGIDHFYVNVQVSDDGSSWTNAGGWGNNSASTSEVSGGISATVNVSGKKYMRIYSSMGMYGSRNPDIHASGTIYLTSMTFA